MKLSVKQTPEIDEEKKFMKKIPYASMVGRIMYVMVCIRLDITYPISLISRFMSNSSKTHWHVIKYIFQYLNCSIELGLQFSKNVDVDSEIKRYVDSDYANNIETRKSLTPYVFIVFGGTE